MNNSNRVISELETIKERIATILAPLPIGAEPNRDVTDIYISINDVISQIREDQAEAPKTRPSTDYEQAMSGKSTMPANSTPWSE